MNTRARVWISEPKRLIYPDEAISHAIFIGLDGGVYQVVKGKLYKIEGAEINFDTGFVDMNGKSIYQKDIVDCDVRTDVAGVPSYMKARGVAEWNKTTKAWYIHLEKQILNRDSFQVENPIVVGNKHLDGELLVSKK